MAMMRRLTTGCCEPDGALGLSVSCEPAAKPADRVVLGKTLAALSAHTALYSPFIGNNFTSVHSLRCTPLTQLASALNSRTTGFPPTREIVWHGVIPKR